MANARKLPSGKWRCLVFDQMEDGKRKYKSFTADSKNEAELQASLYLKDPSRKTIKGVITVKDAIDRYITVKTGVLSPSTIRGYRQIQRVRYTSIENEDITKLNSEKMQRFVSQTAMSVSPKTTANVYALLTASITMFRPDAVFRVTLPKKAKKKKPAPSDSNVMTLFNEADGELKLCIALAAFGSMRRGEICALKYGDVNGNNIYIHADIVMDESNNVVYKDMPKTSESIRVVQVPPQVVQLIGKGEDNDFIIHYTPTGITNAFRRLRNKLSIGDIRFHDLRHYFASIGAVLGIPDIYMSDFGGWRRGSSVLKETYQSTIIDANQKYSDIMNQHFYDLIEGTNEDAT